MRENEAWEKLLDGVIQLENRSEYSVGIKEHVGSLYDELLARVNQHTTDKEEVPRRASFIYRVGVACMRGTSTEWQSKSSPGQPSYMKGCRARRGRRASMDAMAISTIAIESWATGPTRGSLH